MNCNNCGNTVQPNETFCGNCGTPQQSVQQMQTPQQPIQQPMMQPNMGMNMQPQKQNKNMIMAAVVVGLLVIAAVIYFVFLSNDDDSGSRNNNSNESNENSESKEEKNNNDSDTLVCTGSIDGFSTKYEVTFGRSGATSMTMELDFSMFLSMLEADEIEEFEAELCGEFSATGITCRTDSSRNRLLAILTIDFSRVSDSDMMELFGETFDFSESGNRSEVKREFENEGFSCN